MRLLTAAVLCLHSVSVKGAGSAIMAEITRDQAEADATTYDVPPGDCVVMYLKGEKVKGGSSMRKLMDPPVWPGSILIGQEWPYEKSDGTRGCFRDPLATDEKGAQCLNCMLVNSVLTEDTYCSQSETRQYWEYYNDTPNPLTLKFWGAKFEDSAKQTTNGFECIPLNGPVANTCTQTDLPDCNWKGDSKTGGIMKGSPLHPTVACECSCIGGYSSEANGCKNPPSCDQLDLTGSPNVNPSFQNLLFNNDSFGWVSKNSNLNQSMFDGASDAGTMTALMGPVCAPGYQLDTSVTLDCPKKDDTATASGDICIVANDDCGASPCGMGQDCVDMDMMMDGNYECSCQPPGMGTNQNGPVASCGADTDCTDPANVCVTAGQDCVDNDMMKDTNFECKCKPPNDATTAMNAAAMCPPPAADDCNGSDACTMAGQDCVDTDMTADGNYVCSCKPPNNATTAMNAAATCPTDDCAGGMDVCTMAGQDCVDMDGMQDGNLLCRCKAPNIGEAMNAAAMCTMASDDCGSTPCGATQDCVDNDMTVNNMFTCNCKPPGVGTAMGAPAACEDDCTVSVCGADQSCVDNDGLKNSNFQCNCNAPLLGSNVNATAVCTAASQDDCATVPAVCGTGQTCSDPDMMTDNMFTCTCDPPNTGTNNGAPAVCTPPSNDDCGTTPCSTGQSCIDNDGTVNSVFTCNCDPPTTGSGINGPASCATAPPTEPPKEDDDKFLMGLIIGLSVAIICLIGCLYMYWRWRVAKKEAKNARSMHASLPMEESRSTPLLPQPEPVKEEPPVIEEKAPTPPPPPPKPKEIVDSESDFSSSESAILTPPSDPLISGKELVADGNEDLSSLETPPSPPSASRINLRFNNGSSGKPVLTSVKSASPNASTATWTATS
eukprot:TRINITY_DN791_c3_g1_i2.p1 TRINITY_DN791_c3_g1~~TRINITY_DN791_c3_g1_i2.p1  ORF type:complete len:888 (+),score=196.35 TRINITY_DN791_c3_g1_i2:63-2726(+)